MNCSVLTMVVCLLVCGILTSTVHGQWGEWTGWSECSATCGDSTVRYRECDSLSPEYGENGCAGKDREVQWCNGRRNCPINGGWREWSTWSVCSKTCGRQGKRTRFRTCTAPSRRYGGLDCRGDSTSTRPCNPTKTNCPVDGGWSGWGAWKCAAECANGGDGWAFRRRLCSNPPRKDGGRFCVGRPADSTPCSETDCPVDGGWSSWASWGDCPTTCGEDSFRSRKRPCDNPTPLAGGMSCIGERFQIKNCNLNPCLDTSDKYSRISSYPVESGTSPPCDDEDYRSMAGDGGSGCREESSGDISSSEYISSEIDSSEIDSSEIDSSEIDSSKIDSQSPEYAE